MPTVLSGTPQNNLHGDDHHEAISFWMIQDIYAHYYIQYIICMLSYARTAALCMFDYADPATRLLATEVDVQKDETVAIFCRSM